MFLTPVAIAIASPPPPSGMPTQACFEIFADSQGEMARASNPAWRRKARVEIEKARTENNRSQSHIDKELAETAKRRDRVQRAYDLKVINKDKFATLCSEIEAEMQQLILARDTLQIPPCGF